MTQLHMQLPGKDHSYEIRIERGLLNRCGELIKEACPGRSRAAIIKAYYLRKPNLMPDKEVLTVQLNEQSNYPPYVLGRLFSVLEALQQAANPGINTTIKDRFFNAACATPVTVFPTLVKLAQNHLQKLSAGQRTFYDKQITDLMSRLDETYPVRMTMPEQGAFELGYYHQTQKRFTSKKEG